MPLERSWAVIFVNTDRDGSGRSGCWAAVQVELIVIKLDVLRLKRNAVGHSEAESGVQAGRREVGWVGPLVHRGGSLSHQLQTGLDQRAPDS
jgi:hypothetical protein